jgi:hypothetical protein
MPKLPRLPRFMRDLTLRQTVAMVVASGVLLLASVFLSLSLATDTALLNNDLAVLDVKQAQINQANNVLWREIGDVSSAQAMEQRIRAAGYAPPDKVEFLPTAVAPLTATVPLTGTPGEGGR